jgi:hypothetical protein
MNLLTFKGLITCDAATKPDIQFPALLYDHLRGLVKVYRAAGVSLGNSCSGIKFCNKPQST